MDGMRAILGHRTRRNEAESCRKRDICRKRTRRSGSESGGRSRNSARSGATQQPPDLRALDWHVEVIHAELQQRLSDALGDAAVELPLHDKRVNDGAHVIDRDRTDQSNHPGLRVDLDLAYPAPGVDCYIRRRGFQRLGGERPCGFDPRSCACAHGSAAHQERPRAEPVGDRIRARQVGSRVS